MKFFDELRRRNVFRVAGVYGVVGWLLAQAAALLETTLAMPGWFDAMVVSLLLIGFPIALIFAWAFELTPEGVKLTKNVTEGDSITARTGRKLDYAIIGGLALLVVVALGGRFLAAGGPADTEVAAVAGSSNSIAVLPFVDMSSQSDQEYFADGVSEELLNVLAQINGLQVAGRTSAFAFKGQNRDLREIGKILNVETIVEGSIRKAGDRVRITAQLIRAENGYHLWSNTYDRDLTDIFAVQDEIAAAILHELTPFLPAAAQASAASDLQQIPRADIDAYETFLKAREMMNQIGGRGAYEQARDLLDEAIRIDPDYAPALAWRAYAASALSDSWGSVGDEPLDKALPVIKSFAERAIAADPDSADAQFALGAYFANLYLAEGDAHLDTAIATFRKALALRPNFSQAQSDLAYLLISRGDREEAGDILQSVLAHDPGHHDANTNYIQEMQDLGRFDEATAALERWAALRPALVKPKLFEIDQLVYEAKPAEALRLAAKIDVTDPADLDRLKGSIVWAHYKLFDGPWIAANVNRDHGRATAALLNGDPDGALKIIAGNPRFRANPHSAITTFMSFAYAAGDYQAIVDFYDAEVKTPEAAITAVDACGCNGMDTLVGAMQKTGHPDADKILSLWADMSTRKATSFAKSASFHALEGHRSALSKDFEAAKREYATAMDLGWLEPYFSKRLYFYDRLPDDPAFAALSQRMLDRINAQRELAGLEPV